MGTSDMARKPENIKKMSLIELKEVFARQEALLKNNFLIKKLPDKGNSVKKFYEQVQKELKHREELADMETRFSDLNISETDKHIQKVCQIETQPKTERYKPSSTLNKVQEIHTDRKVFKTMEDWSKCNKPTKLIPLTESLEILKQQDEKVKQESLKIKQRHLIQANDDQDEEASASSEESEIDYGDASS